MVAIAVSAVTHNSVTFAVSGEAADGTNEVQLSIRDKFEFCVCPIITGLARGTPLTLSQINQDTTYFARIRSRTAAGIYSDWSPTIPFRTPLNAARSTAPAAVMIQPAILVVPVPVVSWISATTIDGLPAENLAYDAPAAWRSLSAGTTHGVVARVAPEPIDTIALLNTNVPEAGTIEIQAGTTTGTANYTTGQLPFRASANLPGRPGYHSLVRLPAPQAYEYWQAIVRATLPGKILHVEHMVLGLNRTSKNHSTEKNETGLDLGSLERTRAGLPNRSTGLRMRRADFDISMMTEAQYETQYGDLHWKVGGTDPVFVVPNSKAGAFLHDRMLYGAISAGRVVNPTSPRYTRNFTIDSLI